jgi:hypothetical protein
MGNRGILHDDQERLGPKRWQHQSWVTCTLTAPGPKRPLAAPGNYTVLFFLDEAVALAAGHRPYAQCRRGAYNRFVAAWKASHGIAPGTFVPAKSLDAALHPARVTRDRKQIRVAAVLGDLPDGVFVALPEEADTAWLVWRGMLHGWTHTGYTACQMFDAAAAVEVPDPHADGSHAGGWLCSRGGPPSGARA